MNTRIKIIWVFFLLAFITLIVRLFYWQVIKAKELSSQAKRQYQVGYSITAPRGNILASDGSILAGRQEGWLVYASIPDIREKINTVSDKLAPFLLDDPSDKSILLNESNRLKEILSNKEAVWIPIKHKLSGETKKNIEAMDIQGISFEEEELRAYPEASSAAHLLGFVGKNEQGSDQGYFGLEGYYDLVLSGKPGFLSRESDASGSPIVIGDVREVSAYSGVDLLTHIDKAVQLTIQNKLKAGIEIYGAKGGTAIVMNPKTGAVIAMSSLPDYNPKDYSKFTNELFKNPSVSDSFEPGSVFKVLVMAAGLDAKVVKPDTICDICSGPLKVDKYTIETWNKEYRPNSSMVDVIVHSDNVGMSFVGQKLGADKLFDYLNKFGIGKTTGVDLQGEMAPKLREKGTWNIVDLATASFGQGVALTPIELIKAVSAIANGGKLMTPQVVDKLRGEGWEEDIKPHEEGQVIGRETAKDMTQMMVEAAKNGESKWTYLKGFNVAGKTGTAQIPIAGHYDSEKTIASFIGFAPADNPKFIMLVTLKEPQTSQWASETAAPLWYSIAKDLFVHLGILPEN